MSQYGQSLFKWLVLWAICLLGAAGCVAQQDTYELLITNARIIDGTGRPGYLGDIGIKGDRIVAVGDLNYKTVDRIIDANGRVVAPGFIDMMGQNSQILVSDRASAECKIRQGITTLLVGENGAVAPRNPQRPPPAGFDEGWSTFGEYFQQLEKSKIPINVIHNVCEATLRIMIIGDNDVDPTPEQLEQMKAHVEQAMKDGCVGLSIALIYPPAAYAKTEELIELSKVVARYDGVYFAHVRNESGGLLEAIEESIHVGQEADVAIHVYHLKAAGRSNWHLMAEALDRFNEVRAEGLEATADFYPYIRNGIGLRSFIHPRHYAAGAEPFLATLSDPQVRRQLQQEIETDSDWENWYQHVGQNWDNVLIPSMAKSVQQVADERGQEVWDTFFDLARKGTSVNPKSMNEEQKHEALRAEFVCFDTDAAPVNPARSSGVHPRAFGTFPRVLAKYVREENIIPIEQAIRKMTSLPAEILRMDDWGTIEGGKIADLVIFDPDKVRDRATFTDSLQFSEGIDVVIVSGKVILDQGRLTNALPGKVIRHNR